MSGRRYDRILSSTALALILVAPLGARAQDSTANASKQNSKIAATFSERYSSEQTPAPAFSATTTPASTGQPASAVNALVATDQPARPSDPLAFLDRDDRPIAEKIRDLLAAKGEKLFVNKNEREAVETFYQSRNLAPLWLDKGIENARAAAVIARLRNSDTDGLDPADYRTPTFARVPITRKQTLPAKPFSLCWTFQKRSRACASRICGVPARRCWLALASTDRTFVCLNKSS